MVYFSPNRWFSQCIIQQSGQELVKGLTTCLYSQCLVEVGGPESVLGGDFVPSPTPPTPANSLSVAEDPTKDPYVHAPAVIRVLVSSHILDIL